METGKSNVCVGAKVKIKSQHWLRALEEGMVVAYRPRARHTWLVQFESAYPGGGIDGDKLYFDENAFLEVENTASRGDFQDDPQSPGDFFVVPNGVGAY